MIVTVYRDRASATRAETTAKLRGLRHCHDDVREGCRRDDVAGAVTRHLPRVASKLMSVVGHHSYCTKVRTTVQFDYRMAEVIGKTCKMSWRHTSRVEASERPIRDRPQPGTEIWPGGATPTRLTVTRGTSGSGAFWRPGGAWRIFSGWHSRIKRRSGKEGVWGDQRRPERERPRRVAGSTPGPIPRLRRFQLFGQVIGGREVYCSPSSNRSLTGDD